MLPSGLPEHIGDSEVVTRFARFSSQFSKREPRRPKSDLFEPVKGQTALSVSRTSTLSEETVRELGEKVVSHAHGNLRGWCNLNVGEIRALQSKRMNVVAEESGNNHYHAHIEPMPLEKPQLLEAMNELAEIAGEIVVCS